MIIGVLLLNYEKHYISLMNKAKIRSIEDTQYTEIHHIIPKCRKGTNNKENLVILYYREHYLAHWLLCKIYPDDYKLKAAFGKMVCGGRGQRIISSWMFETVKRELKDAHYPWLKEYNKRFGSWNKGLVGKQTAWNKGLKTGPHSEEQNRKRSETLKEHWKKNVHNRKGKKPWCAGTKGVVKAWNKGIPAPKASCRYCKKEVDVLNLKRWHGENCKSLR